MPPPVRDFLAALACPGPIRLIAEVKKASPSKGVIRADFDPVRHRPDLRGHRASRDQRAHRRALFSGQPRHICAGPPAVGLPLLRKDFVVDPYQVVQARAAGADAVLLIAECLDDARSDPPRGRLEFGMTPLVELYEPENLPRVLALGARLIGINNRDLQTFEVDLGQTCGFAARSPTIGSWSEKAASAAGRMPSGCSRRGSAPCSSARLSSPGPTWAPRWTRSWKRSGVRGMSGLNNLGINDSGVIADYPIYSVFKKGDVRTYAVYNYRATPQTVRFSDGTRVTAKSGRFTVKRGQ